MEYILEELLRQRKALAALMNGGSLEKQEDGGEESAVRREQEMAFSADRNWPDGTIGEYRRAARRSSEMTATKTAWDAYAVADGEESGYLGAVLQNGGEMARRGTVQEVLAKNGRTAFRREDGEREMDGGSAGEAGNERAGWQLERLRTGGQTFTRSPGLSGAVEAAEVVSVQTAAWQDGKTAEVDARALSRAVQRDARRYDGGFMAR